MTILKETHLESKKKMYWCQATLTTLWGITRMLIKYCSNYSFPAFVENQSKLVYHSNSILTH